MLRAGVPAWKRLGLKLKCANERPEPVEKTNGNDYMSKGYEAGIKALKGNEPHSVEPPRKRQKTEAKEKDTTKRTSNDLTSSSTTNKGGDESQGKKEKKARKRVSFSADTKPLPDAKDSSIQEDTQPEGISVTLKQPKKKKARKSQSAVVQKSTTALDYLNQYHTARATWKFNKNRDTWILKHVFSESDIPREYDVALSRYIHGLQGSAARERLRTQCVDLLRQEQADENEVSGGAVDSAQTRVEEFRQRLRDDLEKGPTSDSSNEDDKEVDQKYQSWVQETPRPKLLLWSLELDDQGLGFSGTDTASSKPTGTVRREFVNGNNDPQPNIKKRKNRTAIVDYDSSSSSSSSSESDSGSDTDESDSESESEIVRSKVGEFDETSSSGSEDDSDRDSSTEVDSEDETS